jgi:hypothetical protein
MWLVPENAPCPTINRASPDAVKFTELSIFIEAPATTTAPPPIVPEVQGDIGAVHEVFENM